MKPKDSVVSWVFFFKFQDDVALSLIVEITTGGIFVCTLKG